MQMKLLYINACIRDESRTNRLARFLIDQIVKMDDIVEEVKLDEKHLHPLDREALKERSLLLFQDVIDHPVFEAAHQFAQADQIIISAPYYDLSFPSLLKVYWKISAWLRLLMIIIVMAAAMVYAKRRNFIMSLRPDQEFSMIPMGMVISKRYVRKCLAFNRPMKSKWIVLIWWIRIPMRY
jgi:hypothetical protein